MSVLSAGQLNCRVVVKRPSTELDAYGSVVPGWVEVMTVWAAIEPLTGREFVSARQLASEVTHQLTVRYSSLLADTRVVAGYRALYKGRIFNIHAALNEDESNVLVTLLASEGLTRG
jgi:SPP1 family predicted phage head-tail adaptor